MAGKNTNNVNTNTAYNGSYMNIDLNTDYQAKINDAVAKGDYNAASQYEAARNAKINYLNSVSNNPNNYQTTNNYTSTYGSNNKNGVSYTTKYKKLSDLPSNWTTANVDSRIYKNDNGLVSQQTGVIDGKPNYLVKGNKINSETGEWMFDDYEVAKKAAYDNYLMNVGHQNANTALSEDYVRRYMDGTQGQYAERLADAMYKAEYNNKKTSNKSFAEKLAHEKAIQAWYNEEYNSLSDDKKEKLETNSFETDYYNDYRLGNDYLNYMSNIEKRRRMGVL